MVESDWVRIKLNTTGGEWKWSLNGMDMYLFMHNVMNNSNGEVNSPSMKCKPQASLQVPGGIVKIETSALVERNLIVWSNSSW